MLDFLRHINTRLFHSYFILAENHLLIRYSKCGLVDFSVIYAEHLLFAYIKKKEGEMVYFRLFPRPFSEELVLQQSL